MPGIQCALSASTKATDPSTHLALFMLAMNFNHVSQHLDFQFLGGEVLHIQVDREPVLLHPHLE